MAYRSTVLSVSPQTVWQTKVIELISRNHAQQSPSLGPGPGSRAPGPRLGAWAPGLGPTLESGAQGRGPGAGTRARAVGPWPGACLVVENQSQLDFAAKCNPPHFIRRILPFQSNGTSGHGHRSVAIATGVTTGGPPGAIAT